ncbi:hypothetical protein AY498_09490 [Corynebacterium ulcerans]|nr:Phage integrase family protein [Corynebacterium ulcerans]KPH73881.1 hypothetical protein AFK72_11300 [Corynebacterium ulcerans]OIS06655.1 hypothetical protein BHG00_03975 [Corynebacterium ulcerans]PME08216.1 hypothetical protein AY498_09490 [Corynebacterium ulcerans]
MVRGRPRTTPGTHGEITYNTLPNSNTQASTYLRLYNGKTVRVRATAKSKTKAKQQLEQRCQQRLGTPNATTLNPATQLTTLLDHWAKQHDVNERSRTVYTNTINNHITPAIGALTLAELTPLTLQSFISDLTPGTAKTCSAVLSNALKYAVRLGALHNTPWQAIRLPKNETNEIQALTNTQIATYQKAVKKWCGGNDMGPQRGFGLPELIDLLAGSGIRIGEALGLRLCDIDTTNRQITIRGQADGNGGRTETMKNRGSQFAKRTIAITQQASDALQKMAESDLVQVLVANSDTPGETPVFPTYRGTFRTVNNVNRQLRDATEKLPWHITPKSFRSTVASRIAAIHGQEAARLHLGHSSVATTEKYYTAPPPIIQDYITDAVTIGEEPTGTN